MKTIQCTHPHHHNGFVATCRLWTASGGVHVVVMRRSFCSKEVSKPKGAICRYLSPFLLQSANLGPFHENFLDLQQMRLCRRQILK